MTVAVKSAHPWELPDPTVTVAATDPLRFDLRFETDDGATAVSADDQLEVLTATTDGSEPTKHRR